MRKLVYACLFIGWSCHSCLAQLANTTSLLGSVTDSAGAVVAGVSITAVNADTNDTYRTVTNNDGNYTIEFLKIGTYTVTATQPGFQTITKKGIVVDYNQTVRSDFTLAVGQVSERVVVTASTPPISTDEASVREIISEKAVVDLPLNGRDPLQLAATAPGVLPGQKSAMECRPEKISLEPERAKSRTASLSTAFRLSIT